MTQTQNRSLRRRIGAASAALTVAGGGILLMGLSVANPANAAPGDKWFVCKFTTTPGGDEIVQSGQNPISVSENAIPVQPVVVGAQFGDKQDLSIVLVQDTGQDPEPGVEDCEALLETPTPTPTPTPTLTVTETPTSEAAAAPTSEAAPLPGAVEAGKHSTVSATSIALGGALMVAGAGGLAVAARRPRKQHAG